MYRLSIEPGTVLLHYRLIDRLGAGGMAVVWKAVDTTLDREVAIKILPEAFAADHDRLARFEREAKLLASLSHPNVAAIYGRSIDYVETRKDLDASRLAYYGLSWGGAMGAILPAVEPRIKANILYVAGLNFQRALPESGSVA